LRGPSTLIGSEHYLATQVQAALAPAKGTPTTYGFERDIAERALRKAGVRDDDIDEALRRADRYFLGQLCLSEDSFLGPPDE